MTDLQPVRVCFVVENLLPAGTELWVLRLIQHLDRSRIAPSLCLTDGSGPLSRNLEPLDCPTLRLELPHLKSWKLPSAARQLAAFFRSQNVDVVQVHHADPTYLAVPMAKLAGVRQIVQTKYDVGYWLQGADLFLHRLLRRWVNITVANCQACRHAAILQEGAPESQVVVIDNGISVDRLMKISELGPDFVQKPLRIGMLANLRPVKDPRSLLLAAAQLLERGVPVEVHFAGDGELRESLELEAATLGVTSCVTWHGHVSDAVAFLEKMHVVVLCSHSEGLPHALLEAMAAGRAVVATEVGGNAELIESEANGLLVPVGNPSALASAIERLVQNPVWACELAKAARHKVVSHYSLPLMVERFHCFYESLADQNNPVRQVAGIRQVLPTGLAGLKGVVSRSDCLEGRLR